MFGDRLQEMTQAQCDRLAFVELRLRYLGEIRRLDLVTRFCIQAAASRDIAQYKELAPRNLEYDTKGKVYVRNDVRPPGSPTDLRDRKETPC
jgi:hypothetical protein